MKKLPTALEFIEDMQSELGEQEYTMLYKIDVPKKMIEFVKLHLEAQRKAIQKTLKSQEWIDNFINLHDKECKKAIKNAYPLKKIL